MRSTTPKLHAVSTDATDIVPFQSRSNEECVAYLRDMLARAERGEVIGGVCAWMLTSQEFVMDAVGTADQSPVFTIGMLDVFMAKLRRKVLHS